MTEIDLVTWPRSPTCLASLASLAELYHLLQRARCAGALAEEEKRSLYHVPQPPTFSSDRQCNNVTGWRLRNRGAAAPPSRERAQPDVSIAAAVGGTGRDGLKSTPLVICPIRPCRCSRHRLGESLITLRR